MWSTSANSPLSVPISGLDHNHPTSPLLAKPPEMPEETKLSAPMKFVAANTVGEYETSCYAMKEICLFQRVPQYYQTKDGRLKK